MRLSIHINDVLEINIITHFLLTTMFDGYMVVIYDASGTTIEDIIASVITIIVGINHKETIMFAVGG